MKRLFLAVLIAIFSASIFSVALAEDKTPPAKTDAPAKAETPVKVPAAAPAKIPAAAPAKDEVRAVINTTLGVIEVRLFAKEAPLTVSNFVKLVQKGFYNGIVFHRVIPKFMIQTGDPKGTGMGGPGYSFADEFRTSESAKALKHDKAGMLSMANSGPDTNGSQFFITVEKTPHLDGRHQIFGEVTKGLDIAIKISQAKSQGTRPIDEIKMNTVEIAGTFTPVDVTQVKEITEKELKAMTQKPVELLLSKIGEAQGLGKLVKASFDNSRTKGNQAQISYKVEFKKNKGALLLIFGESTAGNFNVLKFQFAKGLAKK